jgi:hypothetical protein
MASNVWGCRTGGVKGSCRWKTAKISCGRGHGWLTFGLQCQHHLAISFPGSRPLSRPVAME